MKLSKKRMIDALELMTQTTLDLPGIKDEAETIKEIVYTNEYLRQCLKHCTVDQKHMNEYMKNNVA